MSGVDNLQGIDYQVSYSVFTLLKLIQNELDSVDSIKFESLTEEEEDLNIYRCNGTKEFIQIKKKAEGYHWTPSEMKTIFEKFQEKNCENINFKIVSNGGCNTTVAKLKKCLLDRRVLSDELLSNFTSDKLNLESLKSILSKTLILTLEFTSNDSSDPALVLNQHIKDLLLSTSFHLSDSVENVFNSLWKYVFDLSKTTNLMKITDIITELREIGISVSNNVWFDLPELQNFKGRKKEILGIKTALFENHRVIVKGISGTGKTMILGKLAQELNTDGKNILWIELNSIFTSSDVLKYIVSFYNDVGYSSQARALQKSEIRDIVPRILDVLRKNEVYLIFDSLDKASIDVVTLVEKIFKESIEYELIGGIVISSVNSLECYMQIDIMERKVLEYELFGLSLEDTVVFFEENNINVSSDDIENFHKAVGGHPISLVFLKQLVNSDILKHEDINNLKVLSIKNARRWLFQKVFSILNQEEKDIILNVSIFHYPFNENEIKQVITSSYKPQYLFDSLIKKSILLSNRNVYYVHDAIRDMLYDMLDTDRKLELHNKVARYYKGIMNYSYKKSGEVLYEDIFKWGYHLEQIKEGENLSRINAELLNLDTDRLDALWAIERFGFPFSFADPELEGANSSVHFLLKTGLIKKNYNYTRKYMRTTKKYVLKNFSFFDSCFLHHLCITRGISNHLGYIEIFEPNDSFHIQGIICPWEHCIEYMPLPPMTKAQYAERINFLQEQFEKGAYNDKSPLIREQLWKELQEGVPEDAPEHPDIELEAASCPIFGHCCPAGKEQASFCRKMDEEVADN